VCRRSYRRRSSGLTPVSWTVGQSRVQGPGTGAKRGNRGAGAVVAGTVCRQTTGGTRGARSLAVQGGGRRRYPEPGQGARDWSGTSLAGWRRPRKCSRPADQGARPANGPGLLHLQGRPDHPATPAAVLQPSGPPQDGTGVAGTPVRTAGLLLTDGHGTSGTCDAPFPAFRRSVTIACPGPPPSRAQMPRVSGSPASSGCAGGYRRLRCTRRRLVPHRRGSPTPHDRPVPP